MESRLCSLLWIVSPDHIELYNGYGDPQGSTGTDKTLLRRFDLLDERLAELDTLAGRLAMETGQFWRLNPTVNRGTSVASRLLRDLRRLEGDLVRKDLDRIAAQALIGQSIFVQYLIDRKLITEEQLWKECGQRTLPDVLSDRERTIRLFRRLRSTFNGDMFPPSSSDVPDANHLARVARFLRGDDTESGQLYLFPYRFNVIPVGLISSIYEQFVHSSSSSESPTRESRTEAKKRESTIRRLQPYLSYWTKSSTA